MKNERTSKRVASIAGRLLAGLCNRKVIPRYFGVSCAELKALAASALTQAPDKSKKGKP